MTCIHVPMADGGEGTMQSLVDATGGTVHTVMVTGPLGKEVEASYGISGDGSTGVLEMASASGIHLVPPAQRNPLVTTTYGTGELIKACLDHGVNRLLIGIGGSATNDGGAGVVQALGGKLLDTEGKELAFGGGELGRLASFDLSGLDSRLHHVEVEVACDVTNPLCGKTGASHVFGPQRGNAGDNRATGPQSSELRRSDQAAVRQRYRRLPRRRRGRRSWRWPHGIPKRDAEKGYRTGHRLYGT